MSHTPTIETYLCLSRFHVSLEFNLPEVATGLSKGKWQHSLFGREGYMVGFLGILGVGVIQVQLLRVLLTDRGNSNITWVIRSMNTK